MFIYKNGHKVQHEEVLKDAEVVLEDSAGWQETDLEQNLPLLCRLGVVPDLLNYAKF